MIGCVDLCTTLWSKMPVEKHVRKLRVSNIHSKRKKRRSKYAVNPCHISCPSKHIVFECKMQVCERIVQFLNLVEAWLNRKERWDWWPIMCRCGTTWSTTTHTLLSFKFLFPSPQFLRFSFQFFLASKQFIVAHYRSRRCCCGLKTTRITNTSIVR